MDGNLVGLVIYWTPDIAYGGRPSGESHNSPSAHKSHLPEPGSSTFLGISKRKMNYTLPMKDDEMTAGFIKRIFHLMKQTLVEDNVRSAFMQLGLRYDIETNPYVPRFDEQVLCQCPGFTSLWEQDYPFEKLSHRRKNTPFGWVNRMMRPGWCGSA
jgi:hypothetical protein